MATIKYRKRELVPSQNQVGNAVAEGVYLIQFVEYVRLIDMQLRCGTLFEWESIQQRLVGEIILHR